MNAHELHGAGVVVHEQHGGFVRGCRADAQLGQLVREFAAVDRLLKHRRGAQ